LVVSFARILQRASTTPGETVNRLKRSEENSRRLRGSVSAPCLEVRPARLPSAVRDGITKQQSRNWRREEARRTMRRAAGTVADPFTGAGEPVPEPGPWDAMVTAMVTRGSPRDPVEENGCTRHPCPGMLHRSYRSGRASYEAPSASPPEAVGVRGGQR
jgi:hypothetical protein